MNEMELLQETVENFMLEFDLYKNIHLEDIYEGTIISISHTGCTIYIETLDNKFPIHISKLSNKMLVFDKLNKRLFEQNNSDNILYKLYDKINVKVCTIKTNKIEFDVV